MRAALVAVAIVVALAGCGPAERDTDRQEVETIVNELDSAVGSAESEIAES